MSSSFSIPELHSLVLDYMSHHCYTNTAHAFLRDTAIKQFDADGDEVELPMSSAVADTKLNSEIREAELRDEISTCILSGRIDDATELLNEHFPTVLSTKSRRNEDGTTVRQELVTSISRDSRQDTAFWTKREDYIAPHSLDPAHLSLNLRIQAFIEMCRTIPLPYKVPYGKKNLVSTGSPEEPRQQASGKDMRDDMALLSKAQKLYALVSMLPNPNDHERYYQELKDVAGLLAYKVPETSSSSKYLSQQRREAVAEQIHSAILNASGRPVISSLELIVRHVSTVWGHAHELGIAPQPGASVPPSAASRGKGSNDSEVVPPFDIELFLEDDKRLKES